MVIKKLLLSVLKLPPYCSAAGTICKDVLRLDARGNALYNDRNSR